MRPQLAYMPTLRYAPVVFRPSGAVQTPDQVRVYQEKAQADSIARQVAPWAYQTDSKGQLVRHPATGAVQFSPAGARYAQHVEYLGRQGIFDPQTQHDIAYRMTLGDMHEQTQTEPPPAQRQATQQMELLKGAAKKQPARTAPAPEPKQPIRNANDFGAALRRNFKALPKEAFADIN